MSNNKIKLGLSTFFLIICIIALIIMGFLVYKFYNEKNIEARKVVDLQSQLSSVNSMLHDLQTSLNGVSSTLQTEMVEKNNDVNQTLEDTTTEIKKYTYSDLKGSYKVTVEGKDYDLDLYENGTFKYEYLNPADIGVGQIGNYIVVDDSIILNYWFSTGSSAELKTITGEKTIKINDDGSLVDSSSGTMSKISSSEDDYDVNSMIENYSIINKTNR